MKSDYKNRHPLIYALLLAIVLALYTLFGALCFCALEGPNESRLVDKRNEARQKFLREIRNSASSNSVKQYQRQNEYQKQLLRALDHYEETLSQCFTLKKSTSTAGKRWKQSDKEGIGPKWTIWGGLYFAGTVYTTIGYGDIVVETEAGKLFTVLYALIGIPLVLTVLNGWGEGLFLLTQFLLRSYLRFWNSCCGQYKLVKKTESRRQKREDKVNGEESNEKLIFGEAYNGEDEGDDLKLENKNSVKDKIGKRRSKAPRSSLGVYIPKTDTEKVQIPLKLAVALLVGWVLLCAAVFSARQKNWSFLDAAYFFFVSLTTIGFGDYTAEHRVACAYFLLVLVGLTVVSMSINVIQQQIEQIFAAIVRAIDEDFKHDLLADAIGFCPSTPLKAPETDDKKKEERAFSESESRTVPESAKDVKSPEQSRKPFQTTIHIELPEGANQEEPNVPHPVEYSRRDSKLPSDEDNAVNHYASALPRRERLLVRLMSMHQKNELEDRLEQRRRMRNACAQTDNTNQNCSVQTDLGSTFLNWNTGRRRAYLQPDEDDLSDTEEGGIIGKRRRSNSMGAIRPFTARSKRMYIYNTGD